MKCSICKNGTTIAGFSTVTLERNGAVIVIKNVPAQVCQNCDEYYLDQKTTKLILDMANDAIKKGAEIEVLKMAKVA